MSDRLSALYEHREYFFKVLKKIPANAAAGTPEEIQIEMYKTFYAFEKVDGKWQNKVGNKMNMVNGLIEAVIYTVKTQEG